jgi:hypothetical protein
MRWAREIGHHDLIGFLSADLGYSDPTPIEPRDELADLLRQSIEANKETQRRQDRIERLLSPSLKAAA